MIGVVVVKGAECLRVAGFLATVGATIGPSQYHPGDLDHHSRVRDTINMRI
jgi:hypothetical protein